MRGQLHQQIRLEPDRASFLPGSVSTPMKDGLTLVERYFVEELNSHFGESLAREWLACEKRRKCTRESVHSMPRSSSQAMLAREALGMNNSMQRSHSETSLGSLQSKA